MTQSLSERLSSLSLPEVSRDDITRTLSGLPTPDLSGLERPSLDLPEVDLRKIDLSDAVMGVATAVGLKRSSPARWPFALGAAALLVAGALITLNRRAVMIRLDPAMIAIERWIAQVRYGRPSEMPVAFTAAQTAPIQPAELTGETGADYPDGLGADSGPEFDAVSFDEIPEPATRSPEVAAV